MIYLTNTVSAQTVSIPRNDNGGTPSINPRSYQEGYNAGFEAGEDVGYGDGIAYQKSLLSSTAITENGEYSRENGFSAVSVNVPQTGSSLPLTAITITANTAITESEKAYTGITVNVPQTGYTQQDLDNAYNSGYTSGETAGYNSGYTSGETHQKSLLSSTAITENGEYQSENGFSAVSVNVQTGITIPLTSITITANTAITETDKAYTGITVNVDTASTYNSGYTDGYTSGETVGYESGYTSGYSSGYTSGYTSGITEGENNIISTFSAMTATTNGNYGSSAHPLSSITVIIDTASTYNNGYTSGYTDGYSSGFSSGQTSIIDTFTAITATTNGVYGSTGYPLSSITVNVPQSDVTEAIISVTGNTWFILDHIFRYGEKINIKHTTFDYSAANVVRHQQLISGGQGEYLRIAGAGGTGNKLYVTYGNTNKAQIDYVLTDNEIELTPTEFYIDGVKVANVSSSTHTWNTNMVLFANDEDGGDSVSGQTASVGEITITNSANTITAHYVPTLDGNNVPCFYNTVSDNYIYAESGTPIYNSTVSFLTIDNLARRRYTYINPHISVNPRPYSFYEATELYGDLSFGNSVTSIGYAAFEACDNLNGTLTIPNSVTGIGEYAFAAEFSGTLTIPDSITEIKKGAFYGCNFTTVIIPSSVTDIKSTAFFWNQETDIYCYATTPPLIDDRIVGYSSSGRIHYPAGSDYTLWTQSSQFANWTFIDDL